MEIKATMPPSWWAVLMLLEDKAPKTAGMLATRLLEIFPELVNHDALPQSQAASIARICGGLRVNDLIGGVGKKNKSMQYSIKPNGVALIDFFVAYVGGGWCKDALYSTKYSVSVEESRYFRPTLVMSEVPAVVRGYQPKVTHKSHPHLFRLIA